jgi:hypothetical protein
VTVPSGPEPQTVRTRILEAIRSNKYREHKGAELEAFGPRQWQRWTYGAADIVMAAGSAEIRVTCPDEFSSVIRQIFPAADVHRYEGHRRVWPVVEGAFRVSAVLIAFVLAVGGIAYLIVAP